MHSNAVPPTRTATRTTTTILLAILLALTGPLGATPAVATHRLGDGDRATIDRFAEPDHYLLASQFTAYRFRHAPARSMILARGDVHADALAAAPLTHDGGLLLLPASDELPDYIPDYLNDYLAADGTVYLMGGTAAINDSVADQLVALGWPVHRIAGSDRIGTALAAAHETVRRYGPPDTIFLARAHATTTDPSAAWADAIAAAAPANATGNPILLTTTASLHPQVEAFIGDSAPERTILLGGTGALSADVEHAVPSPIFRAAGADRADTAVRLAHATSSTAGIGTVLLYPGHHLDGWARGLIIATIAVTYDGRLIPLPRTQLPRVVAEWLVTDDACYAEKFLIAPHDHVDPEVSLQIYGACSE
jgi:putative cell wall-binding protein